MTPTQGAFPEERTGVRDRLQALDERAFEHVAGWHTPMLDRVLPRLSVAASYSRLWVAIAVLVAAVGGRRGRRAAVEALVAVGVTSAVANQGAKRLADRRRPLRSVPDERRLEHPGSSSFPSGHTASAAAFSGVIGAEIPGLRLPLNALAAGVGLSRVYTGVHYPGDVAVGWVLGKGMALVVRRLAGRVNPTESRFVAHRHRSHLAEVQVPGPPSLGGPEVALRDQHAQSPRMDPEAHRRG